MSGANPAKRALQYAGLMGHIYAVVGCDPIHGWRVVMETDSLADARATRDANTVAHQVYQRSYNPKAIGARRVSWRKVPR